MTTKHTPGPWQAYEAFSGKHYVGTPHKGIGHFVIADVMPSKMETIHNARLIASSPDLLDELHLCATLLESIILPLLMRDSRHAERAAQTRARLMSIRDTIAKTKGE